jgi:hypothetical protein
VKVARLDKSFFSVLTKPTVLHRLAHSRNFRGEWCLLDWIFETLYMKLDCFVLLGFKFDYPHYVQQVVVPRTFHDLQSLGKSIVTWSCKPLFTIIDSKDSDFHYPYLTFNSYDFHVYDAEGALWIYGQEEELDMDRHAPVEEIWMWLYSDPYSEDSKEWNVTKLQLFYTCRPTQIHSVEFDEEHQIMLHRYRFPVTENVKI